MSIPTPRERHLLLSIHDVSPRFESAVDRLQSHLCRHAPEDRIALLVVPNYWGETPITAGSPFATRLRAWAERGTEIFLHGWFHRDLSGRRTSAARFKASYMTAGEGEFLGLDRAGAVKLMLDGRALLEDITGRDVAGFIAPAWLYGPGALEALADCRFALAEDHWKVWHPVTGRILSRSPVLTWASRSPSRIASSLFVARALPPLLRRLSVARIGVHPGDTGVPALMASIDRTIANVRKSHSPARYRDLLGTEQTA